MADKILKGKIFSPQGNTKEYGRCGKSAIFPEKQCPGSIQECANYRSRHSGLDRESGNKRALLTPDFTGVTTIPASGNGFYPERVNRFLGFCFILIIFLAPLCVNAKNPVTVLVEGLEGDELANVETALTLPPGLEKDGMINEEWLSYFIRQIPVKTIEALKPFGFYKPLITVSPVLKDDNIREIHVVVEPGKPVRIVKLNLDIGGPGKNEKTLADLMLSFPLKKGDVLRQDIYENAKKDIQDQAIELGYLDASFTTHRIGITPEEAKAEIDLLLDTGPLYYFGSIKFSGAPEYPVLSFSRYVEFETGDIFSYDKIGLTHRNLINSDLFEEVMIRTDRENTDNQHVSVEILLVPSKPKRLKFGLGYETDIGPKGTIRYEDVNIFKTSHRFECRIDISESLQTVGARYTIPDRKDTKSFSLLSFNMKREDGAALFTESMTAEFERARTLRRNMTGSIFTRMLKERSDAGDEKTKNFLLLPGFRLSALSYDNLVHPTRGYRFATELIGTHQILGSDTGLFQMTIEGGLIIPLPAKFTVLTRAKIGATATNEPRADLPIALRFFAGGDQNVRGYKYKSLGPKDADGDVLGGKHIFVASIELERAIGKNWGVAAFYDTGNAFNDFSKMRLAQGAGVGARYYSPLGPVKIDIARQIGVRKPHFRLHISIGLGL